MISLKGICVFLLTPPLFASLYHEGPLPEEYDYLAPDGSEIRFLSQIKGGNSAHCTLPSGNATQAIMHQNVEEIWHILEGEGQLWRKKGDREEITPLSKGMTVAIVPREPFQFRCTSETSLQFIIFTSPAWPGSSEAIPVQNHWDD